MGTSHREPVDEQEEPAGHCQSPGDVIAGPLMDPAFFDKAHRTHHGQYGNGHVDEKGPAPRRPLGQGAAQDEAYGRPATGDGAVDAESTGSLLGRGERRGENRQGAAGAMMAAKAP